MKVIRLTESDITKIIRNSVRRMLKERFNEDEQFMSDELATRDGGDLKKKQMDADWKQFDTDNAQDLEYLSMLKDRNNIEDYNKYDFNTEYDIFGYPAIEDYDAAKSEFENECINGVVSRVINEAVNDILTNGKVNKLRQ